MQHKKALRSAQDTAQTSRSALRRELARRHHLEQLAECPGHLVLGLASERWATLIVEALLSGPRRYAELRRQVPGATQKMLTQTLRSLERSGLVDRSVHPTMPVGVEYRLTDLGAEFAQLQREIYAWAVAHSPRILEARSSYDAAAARRVEPSVVELNQERFRPGSGGRRPGS